MSELVNTTSNITDHAQIDFLPATNTPYNKVVTSNDAWDEDRIFLNTGQVPYIIR